MHCCTNKKVSLYIWCSAPWGGGGGVELQQSLMVFKKQLIRVTE